MDDQSLLLIEVFDKALAYQGTVGRPQDTTFTIRDSSTGNVGTGEFTIDADEDVVAALSTSGARVLVRYRYDPNDPTQLLHVMSGPVDTVDTGGGALGPTRTYAVVDDLARAWQEMVCWPVPASAIGSQGTGSYTITGPAETVIKDLVTKNKGHLPAPAITVETDGARGQTITALMQFDAIADKLVDALALGGISFRLRQSGTSLVFDARAPATLPPVSVESGIVATGTAQLARPTASRAIVRGGSDGSVARLVVNAPVEAAYGYCGDIVVDVTESTDPATLDAKGNEALAAAARTTSLNVTLAETDDWRLGIAYQCGDILPIQLVGTDVLSAPVTEVEIKQNTTDGVLVTPKIGDHTSDPNAQLAQQVAKLQSIQRNKKAV